ncbi:hypothetical protein TorRG33x02_217190, partial [Trema orientale]
PGGRKHIAQPRPVIMRAKPDRPAGQNDWSRAGRFGPVYFDTLTVTGRAALRAGNSCHSCRPI